MTKAIITLIFSILIFSFSSISAKAKPLRILLVGDSLTLGLHEGQFHPYSIYLTSKLYEAGINHQITHAAVAGVGTTSIKKLLTTALSEGSYDIVGILGGTNDIPRSVPADEVIANLTAMYEAVLDTNAKLIVMTIPKIRKDKPYFALKRSEINYAIRKFADSNESDRLALLNLYEYADAATCNKAPIWSDNVHFSPYGYDAIGHVFFQILERMGWITEANIAIPPTL